MKSKLKLKPAKLPKFLYENEVELYADKTGLVSRQGNRISRFPNLLGGAFDQLAEECRRDVIAQIGLDKMGIRNPMSRIEQYGICNYGNFDFEADLDRMGLFHKEVYDCGFRGNCPVEDLVCCRERNMLSKSERPIAALIAEGKTNKEIAVTLGVSVFTVNNHIRHISSKLRCYSRAAIAAHSVRMNLKK